MLFSSTVYSKEIKGRIVEYTVREVQGEICDVPGHKILMHEHEGLAFFGDGEIASVISIMTIDFNYDLNTGTHNGYRVYTFEDSSTQVTKIEGTQRISEDGKLFSWEAKCEYILGTGRFEGIRGKVSYTGKSLMSARKTGFVDFSGAYTIPSPQKY